MSVANGEPKLRVAVIGAGMGGLVLGLCLKKYAQNVHFDIYESAAELTEIGAGIGMTQRVWSIMEELGIQDELVTITGTNDRKGFPLNYCKGDEEPSIDLFQLPQLHTFQRSVLQQLLAKHLDAGDKIHFSKRLASYSETSPTDSITLNFRDGSTATCDLVIGSDGIRSAVRRTMYNELANEAETRGEAEQGARLRAMIEPVFSGQIAYRGLAPTSALPEDALERARTAQILLGKNAHMALYPVAGGKLVNVVAVKYTPGYGRVYSGPWVESISGEAATKPFEGWDPKALAIIKALSTPFCWALHTVPDLPTYVKGRVALIGDAAHAMLPHQGAGVGQAFEDGVVLASILADASVIATNLPAALAIYDTIRRPFSQGVQQASDWNGVTYQLRRAGSGWEGVSEADSRAGRYPRERLDGVEEQVRAQMRWQFETRMEGDRARLAEMLNGLSG